MSQLPIQNEPRSAEEWVSYLAEILLKEERIVSDSYPHHLTKSLSLEWFNNNYAAEINTSLIADSWSEIPVVFTDGEEHLEPEEALLDSMLALYKESTENMILMLCCDCPDSEIVDQLSKWGPGQ